MPGFDRSGPLGYGPRSGRGFGFCGFPSRREAFSARAFGRGFGRGFGFGRGYWVDDTPNRSSLEDEISFLEARVNELKKMLDEGDKN